MGSSCRRHAWGDGHSSLCRHSLDFITVPANPLKCLLLFVAACQGFEVLRLKDKLGTRQLPTAELLLTGIRGLKVKPLGSCMQPVPHALCVRPLPRSLLCSNSMLAAPARPAQWAVCGCKRAPQTRTSACPVHQSTAHRPRHHSLCIVAGVGGTGGAHARAHAHATLPLHAFMQISEAGRGVPAIAPMVNITRLHNAAAAASYMRRITALAQAMAPARAQLPWALARRAARGIPIGSTVLLFARGLPRFAVW